MYKSFLRFVHSFVLYLYAFASCLFVTTMSSDQNSESLNVKVSFNNSYDIIVAIVKFCKNSSFDKLFEAVRTKFRLLDPSIKLRLAYTDEGGQLISMFDQDDLERALKVKDLCFTLVLDRGQPSHTYTHTHTSHTFAAYQHDELDIVIIRPTTYITSFYIICYSAFVPIFQSSPFTRSHSLLCFVLL